MRLGQRGDRGVHRTLQLSLQQFRIRLAIWVALDQMIRKLFAFVRGNLLFAATAARLVKNEIARDREQIGRELRVGPVALCVFPNPQEYLLGNVFRL